MARLPPPSDDDGTLDALSDKLSRDRIDALADMIADGRCDFPTDLPSAVQEQLRKEVPPRLRRGLLRLVARAIAYHLRRTGQSASELDLDRTQI
jgi:hypothetical protein